MIIEMRVTGRLQPNELKLALQGTSTLLELQIRLDDAEKNEQPNLLRLYGSRNDEMISL